MATAESPRETREDDGAYERPSDTCVVVRHGSERQVLEVRDHAEVIVGRGRGATVAVEDERVSRRHLRLAFREGALWAADLGSRNGTTLNGRRLTAESALAPGDELVAGPVHLTVCGARQGAVADEGELWTRLVEELERAQRLGRALSLVGLALAGEEVAQRAAARAVAARLGRIERVGMYAPGSYIVVLPETAVAEAERRGAEYAAVARRAGVTVTVRAVEAPRGGVTVDELVAQLGVAAAAPGGAPAMVAVDPAMREVLEQARRAALSDVTVLIVGETGSGKELLADEIHRAGPRAARSYVRVNCAALPSTLLESELFGHERGAFTGAERRRIGFIEAAHGGTFLFDEIGELPLETQAKLLRVLEQRQVTRLGGTEVLAVDVRFLVATHRDLERDVAAGRFRQDLLFRINALTLRVPALRARPLDLPLLAERFVAQACAAAKRPVMQMTDGFLTALARYPWPGNVRELRNVLERAVVLSDDAALDVQHLPQRFSGLAAPVAPVQPMRERVDELERGSLLEALRDTGGNRTHAARRLGISRRALLYKLKKYGIE